MSENICLSVIIPVYNVEKYLKRAINSIKCQSFTDYEIILCDDGSTDASGKICDELAADNENITVIHKQNGGVSSARNVGLDVAKGRYIYFMDPDDYLTGELFSENIALAERYACDQVIFSFGSEILDNNDNVINKAVYHHGLSGILNGMEFRKELLRHLEKVNQVVWNRIYKKSSIGEIRFRDDLNTAEDAIFNIELIKKGVDSICYNDKIYYAYMCRANSLMNKYNPYRFENEMMIIDAVGQIAEGWGAEDEFKAYLSKRYIEAMLLEYTNVSMCDCKLTLNEIKKRIEACFNDERVKKAKAEFDKNELEHISLKILYILSERNMYRTAYCFKKLYTSCSLFAHMLLSAVKK